MRRSALVATRSAAPTIPWVNDRTVALVRECLAEIVDDRRELIAHAGRSPVQVTISSRTFTFWSEAEYDAMVAEVRAALDKYERGSDERG